MRYHTRVFVSLASSKEGTSMADNGQGKERKKRIGPSVDSGKTSRVSKAAGNIGSEAMRVEQRSGSAATKQRANNAQNSSRRTKAGNGKQQQQPARKGSSANRPVPGAPGPKPADSRLIAKYHGRWQSLAPHHKQRLFSVLLLGLAVFLFGGLTFWNHIQLLGKTGSFFTLFFGWGAYPLALGLILFAFAHLVEGMRKARFIRWSLVIGLLIMLLLLLAESRLFTEKPGTGGILGDLLARPLIGWPAPTPHILVIGLVALAAIYAFRIRHGHVTSVTGFIKRSLADPKKSAAGQSPSPYLGQRPQYSQFAQNRAQQL